MTTMFGRVPLRELPRRDRVWQAPQGQDAADAPQLAAPLTSTDGGITVGLAGRPRIGDAPSDAPTIASQVLAAYRARGQRCLEDLRGSFALCLLDAERGELLLAVDRMGIESLSWTLEGSTLVFGTSMAEVTSALAATPSLDPQAVFDFMLGHMIAAPDTVFAGVFKLPPACFLSAGSAAPRVQRYWNPDFHRPAASDLAALERETLDTLGRSVAAAAALGPDGRVGSFLSGGLDSSTVTGLLARATQQRSPAFSVGFGVAEFNELDYARIAARSFGCPHHEYHVTPTDIVELVPRIAALYDEPFGNSSAVPTLCCARLAKEHGVDHLLAGDGGDEIFGGNERYVRQKVFEHYGRIPARLRTAVIEPLAALFDPERAPLPLRKFASYVRQARVPLPERYETWNMVYNEGPTAIFDGELLAAVDTRRPLAKMRETWEECPSNDLLDRMLWYDWKYTLADNDLRKVRRTCELAGVDVSFPMLDEPVVELSLKVPSSAKIEGNELRSFFKRSARGLLPPEIIDKKKHGFGLPFGVWLKTHEPLQELVYDSLTTLKLRGLLNRQFIERVATEHREGHAGYYGYAIWDLLMLEQWLEQHGKPAAGAAGEQRRLRGAQG